MALVVLQVSYAIGVAQPLSVHVDSYGTGTIPDKEILQAVLKNFDFRPGDLLPLHDSAAISSSICNLMLRLIESLSHVLCTLLWKCSRCCLLQPQEMRGHGAEHSDFEHVNWLVCRTDRSQPGPQPPQVQEDCGIRPLWPRARLRLHLGEGHRPQGQDQGLDSAAEKALRLAAGLLHRPQHSSSTGELQYEGSTEELLRPAAGLAHSLMLCLWA